LTPPPPLLLLPHALYPKQEAQLRLKDNELEAMREANARIGEHWERKCPDLTENLSRKM
jgi:hypothetical protein